MIKNLVFDFGNVLAHFDPAYMVGLKVTDRKDAELLKEVVFDRLYWDKLDLGTLSNEETAALYRERLPERLWQVADGIFYNWVYTLPEMEGMRELIELAKKKYGVRTFLLSNISKYFAEHRKDVPILGLIDNCVFSAEIGIVKPDKKIYEYLLRTYSLDPEETVFIDDREENVAAANALNIHGYRFDGDAQALESYLDRLSEEG